MSELGSALRRMRRLRGMKQGHAAELLGVSQATVSRWEAGLLVPSSEAAGAIRRLTAASVTADAALKRLVEAARTPVHLICDASHVLLAASPARRVRWRGELAGRSLWPFASAEIAAAEARLGELGWREGDCDALVFHTGANRPAAEVPIAPGLVLWERLSLADGRALRLVSTVDLPPAHALALA